MAKEDKKTILITDDDTFLLDMYALKFSENGFQVISCLGSHVALEKFREGIIPNIALLDIVMPSMDGFELLETLNKEGLGKSTVKIFLSNRGQAEDVARGRELGAAGYIIKATATPSEVVKKVMDIFNMNNGSK